MCLRPILCQITPLQNIALQKINLPDKTLWKNYCSPNEHATIYYTK